MALGSAGNRAFNRLFFKEAMEMKKRITSILLALVVALSCSVPAFAAEGLSNFKKVNAYASGQFKDVADGEWYTENVKTAYELGLMKGSGALFNIRGNINLAETLAIACRIRDTYYGGTGTFEQGSPWYQVYVDYAVANDIIVPGEYAEYTKPATRTQFAKIIAERFEPEPLVRLDGTRLLYSAT